MAQPKYKKLLITATELRQQAGKYAYKRAKILVEVFLDKEFRQDNDARDDYGLMDLLDLYVEDLCVTFAELRAMLEQFPNEADWADGRLTTLHQRTLDAAASEKVDVSFQASKRSKTDTALEQQRQQFQARAGYLETRHSADKQRIAELEQELKELREENSRLLVEINTLRAAMSDPALL